MVQNRAKQNLLQFLSKMLLSSQFYSSHSQMLQEMIGRPQWGHDIFWITAKWCVENVDPVFLHRRNTFCEAGADGLSVSKLFYRKGVIKNLAKFTGKPTTLLKKGSGAGVFLWTLRNF